MHRPPPDWVVDPESEVLLGRLSPSTSDDSSSGSSSASFDDQALPRPQSKLVSFGQNASRRLSLDMPALRTSSRLSPQPVSPPPSRTFSSKSRISLLPPLLSRSFLEIGHHAIRQLLVELSLRISSLDARVPDTNPPATRSGEERAEDEEIMSWLSLFAGFVRHWLAVEGRLVSEVGELNDDWVLGEIPAYHERRCALQDSRVVISDHLARIDSTADRLFLTPIAKLYQELRADSVTANHLLQTYFRTSMSLYQPMLRQMSGSFLAHLERKMATEMGQTDSGPAHLVILTRWMERDRAAEWRKHRLDHRKRSSVKKAEGWYTERANHFNESSLRVA